MCLYVKDIQKQVATEPIKVYKVLDINDQPPYYPSITYHVGINEPQSEPYPETAGKYWVGPGYLHAYTDREQARSAARSISWCPETDTVRYKIVEMHIPEGAAYYWHRLHNEVAAEALEWRPDSPVETGESDCAEDLPF